MKSWREAVGDIPASFVVFLVALPLCMGIAIASGVPPALGLVTGIVGGLVTGFLAGAPLQVSGPAAGLTVLVYQVVEQFGLAGLGPIVLLAGAMQLLAGSAKLGQWFRAVSPSVIYGMLSGIGVLIILSQIHVAFDGKPSGSPLDNILTIPVLLDRFLSFDGESTAFLAGNLGMATLVLIFVWDKFAPQRLKLIPAPLLAVVAASFVAWALAMPIAYVDLPDEFSSALLIPVGESWRVLLNEAAWVSAAGLAVIASAETLLCASALKKMRANAEVKYDKELLAQGAGNMVCGLLGALPMTGVIVRSTANINANGRTRWSAIFHGAWLLLFVIMVPHVLEVIPMASLAAILVYTGLKLVNPVIIKRLAAYGKPAVVIYTITVAGIVFTDLLTGVLLGVAASFARLLTLFSNLKVHRKHEGDTEVLELKGAATFLTLPKLAAAMEAVPLEQPIELRFDSVFYIDHSCMDLIETQKQQRKQFGGALHVDSSRLQFTWRRSEKGDIAHPQKAQLVSSGGGA